METEKASHEAEVKLIPAPPNPPHQTGEQITELQNGNQSPKLLHQQVNGDPPWNHCTPNGGVNQMKRHQNNSPFSAEMQEMFGYSPDIGIKHVFSEPPLLGHYQPKRIRVDMENNDQEDNMMIFQDKEKSLSTESKLDCFPDFSKITEFECNVFQEDKLGKKNCVWSHRDIFTLSRNKQTAVLNGARVTSETTEGTCDDLTEKTRSTYYPCIPTASQKVTSPQNAAAVSLTENGIPGKQATHSASLTSGVPISPQISAADQLNRICSNTGGYSGHTAPLAVDLQQQRSRQLCPLNGVHAAARPHSLVPGMDLPPSGGRHSAKDFSNYLNASNAYEEFSQRSSPGAKLQTVEPEKFPPYTGTPTARMKGNEQLQSGNHPQGLNNHQISQEGQHQVQYGTQEQPDNLCEPDSHCRQRPFFSDLPNQITPLKPPEDEQNSTCDREPQMNSTESQAQGNGMQRNISIKVEAEETFQPQDPYPRMNWIDPKCSPSPQTWKGFASHPQQEQQEMIQGSVHSSNPLKGFKSQGFKQSDCQQPEKLKSDQVHNQTRQQGPVPEWQPSNAKPSTNLHAQMQQVMSPQYGLPQEQGNSIFHTQIKQDSCENIQEDLDEILNSNFLLQQPPLPCLPNEYQDDNLLQKHPSQCELGGKLSQPPSQQPLDSQIFNRQKLNAFISQDKQLNIQRQMVSNPTAISAPGFLNSPLPDTQPQHNVMSPYSNANGATIPDDYRLEKTIVVQQQPKYSPGPLDQRQYLQQHKNQQQSNRVDFQQPPPPLTSKQQQPQSPQAAPNPMYPKAEWPDSCSQARGGQFPSQNHRDVQRHAALRMHLLQRQGHQQNLSDFQYLLQSIKKEKGPKFELPMQQSEREQVGPSMQALVKQEQPWAPCERSQQKSIIATMENQLKRYQLSPLFEKKSLDMKSPNKIKVEMSGPVTILSTHADLGDGAFGPLEQNKTPSDFKNTKRTEPTLNSFLESPLKLFNTPIKNVLDTPVKTQYEFSSCHCVEQVSEKDEGPYYTHLGAAPNIAGIRGIMEKRYGQAGSSIRIEKVVYTGKEGKSAQGCPIAKWVIRRANMDEKVLVLVRERAGHTCETATIVVAIMIWEGISTSLADRLYTELSDTLQRHGALTNRRCALNEERTCACQGLEPETCGASFSFGCSWSMYYNGCKFARSKIPRKFKLLGDDPKEEEKVEQHLQNLATVLAPTYKQMAPDAYANQVEHENRAIDCRLGKKEGRPFSGVTACLDFCAHAHRDLHNMQGGSTVVCTLTREDNREIGKIPEDEQLHVLPLYKVSQTDEFGSAEGQRAKIESGAIQVLSAFRRKVRMLSEPAKSCRQRKLESKRGGANKSSNPDTPNSKAEKALPAKPKSCCNENTGQSTLVSGPPPGYGQLGAALSGNQQLRLGAQQKQQQQIQQPHSLPNPHPSSSNQTQPRFPNRADRFPSTSHPNMFPPSPAMVSPYPSQMHTTNSHLNGSNPANSHPGSLTTGNYPGYQCNGGIPKDNHSPYYVSNPKHLDMFQPPRRQLYPHQYSAPRHFGVSYPTLYGEHGAQVNGYSKCNTRPNVPTLGPHSLDPNSRLDPEYLEAISRIPSTQLNYAALSKNGQYGAHANPCLAQGSPTFPPGLDSVRMQKIPEVNLQGMNGMVQVNPALGNECSTAMPLVCGFQNGDIHGTPLKQEPGVQTSGKKEEVWSDNEHNFLDPEIGGVALAPSHGSILIECAKRELHATTPLKNPERNHPTRISLVFYQHKSMNEAKHGLALWEAKMAEKAREKEEDPEKHGTGGTPGKSKKVKREDSEASRRVEPAYKHFVKPFTQSSISCTTNTYVSTAPYAFTRVTGPYNCYM